MQRADAKGDGGASPARPGWGVALLKHPGLDAHDIMGWVDGRAAVQPGGTPAYLGRLGTCARSEEAS